MPCTALPKPSFPQLPPGISLGSLGDSIDFPPGSPIEGQVLCCRIRIPLPTPQEIASALGLPPLPPGPVIGTALLAALNSQIVALNEYIDKIPFSCPLE